MHLFIREKEFLILANIIPTLSNPAPTDRKRHGNFIFVPPRKEEEEEAIKGGGKEGEIVKKGGGGYRSN